MIIAFSHFVVYFVKTTGDGREKMAKKEIPERISFSAPRRQLSAASRKRFGLPCGMGGVDWFSAQPSQPLKHITPWAKCQPLNRQPEQRSPPRSAGRGGG